MYKKYNRNPYTYAIWYNSCKSRPVYSILTYVKSPGWRKVMKCPICDSPKTRVAHTYNRSKEAVIERKRQCKYCKGFFLSIEVTQPPRDFTVIKRSGKPDTFSYDKILNSIELVCQGLSLPFDERRAIFIRVMNEITIISTKKNLIKSVDIGEIISNHLQITNRVAWLRFLSFHDDNEVNLMERISAWASSKLDE